MDKICNFCGNKNFRDKLVQYLYRSEGRFLVVNNVPCEECEYCGEQYFMADVLRKIEKDFCEVYHCSKKAKYEVSLPVEDFAELQ
ncbi:MAG: type II toxin-antitoxin system MqsA family antitoxin [Deltaproteobacteria bacterium]|nr:type II toxin-antitoxin system MqsA family antitoxin [Deltaproteobacteria bacterium]